MKIYWSEEQDDYVFKFPHENDYVFILSDYYNPFNFYWEALSPVRLELVVEVTDDNQ